jgi:hypothetical protein
MYLLKMLFRVEAPHYVAGFITRKNIVIQAAPILKWTIGRNRWDVVCNLRDRRGTTVTRIKLTRGDVTSETHPIRSAYDSL